MRLQEEKQDQEQQLESMKVEMTENIESLEKALRVMNKTQQEELKVKENEIKQMNSQLKCLQQALEDLKSQAKM